MRLTIHRLNRLPEQHSPQVDIILQGRALPEQASFYLATFNDKAVALAWCQQERLDFIAVRDITRRRGIGQELLRQIKADANAAGLTQLTCEPAAAPKAHRAELAAFLASQGFSAQAGMLSCNLNQ